MNASGRMNRATESRDQADARVGDLLNGRYKVLRFIGAGGMGEVYEAEHIHIGRPVAIKFLRRCLANHPNIRERFRFEARAAGQLASEHVVAVLDWGTTPDDGYYLVMEKLRGETLAQRLARRRILSVPEAVGIIAQASHGVQAAHDRDIVHCDLKPSNLFITTRDDGTELVKLLDFGVARLLGQGGQGGIDGFDRAIGTPSYMSPEQASASESIDGRSDVYALGVILYSMLCGELPHGAGDPAAIRCRILRDAPPDIRCRRQDIAPELAAIVHCCLARDPSHRHASALALADALEAFELQNVSSANDRNSDVELLQETCADPPTQTDLESNCGSEIRHAVALDVVSTRKPSRYGLPLPRWILGVGALALLSLYLGAPYERSTKISQAHQGVYAASVPIASNGVVRPSSARSEDCREELNSPHVAIAAQHPPNASDRALTNSRSIRRRRSALPVTAGSKFAPPAHPAVKPEHHQETQGLVRNYDQLVGF